MTNHQGYYAYGRYRTGGIGLTDHKFTGQKRDRVPTGRGLQYFNARYYDPDLGQFLGGPLGADTIVPDPTNVFGWNRYMYTIGNPMRFNDPSGHDWRDVITTFVDFAQGVGAQVGYNNTAVALPSEVNSLAPQSGESTAMQAGRFIGNVVTAVQGVAEISGGAGLGGAGVAACTTGVGCVATAPAVIGASAVIAHGGTVATIGAVNAGVQLGNAVMAMMGEGDNEGAETNSAPCSFESSTLVTTDKGRTPISDITVGDFALAFNESTGTIGYYKVTAVMKHADLVLVTLMVNGESIVTTPEHPFYITDQGWIPAGALQVGEKILRANGQVGTVKRIAVTKQLQVMYNLTVADAHTFFVGDGQWLVHNECRKVLQTGGNTLDKGTLKELGLSKQQGKQAIESLKADLGFRNDFHAKIWSNGDVTHPKTGEVLGNLFDYVD